jgi:hypothetical protein
MKKVYLIILVLSCFAINAKAQSVEDTLREQITEMKDRINGIEERLMTSESDLSKHNKIKISGYIQGQFDYFENHLSYPNNSFQVRRTRLKLQYEATDGIKFVLQPELGPGGFELKDAYVTANSPILSNLDLWIGKFNRPNYEVEYSSSQREVPERSRIIKALYPGERAIGAKLEYNPKIIPLKFQFAVLNGNDGYTYKDAIGNNMNSAQAATNKDFDNFKDFMFRATYTTKLNDIIGLDFGFNGYLGQLKATSTSTIKGDYTLDNNTTAIGDVLKRNWIGAEFQLYIDFLGGMSLKGEYMMGQNALPGYIANATTTTTANSMNATNDSIITTTTNTINKTQKPNQIVKFSGGYLYLNKNIGKKNQFTLRYDFYDPNTEISGDAINSKFYNANIADVTTTKTTTTGKNIAITKTVNQTNVKMNSGTSDISYKTLTLAWNHYLNDNIRITFAYEIPMNEKTNSKDLTKDASGNLINMNDKATINGVDQFNYYNTVFKQNVFTLRLQAKF